MAKNTPAFQYYPADLISDPDVMFWDMETLGCYWQLITYLWLNGGNFEFNVDKMRVLFRFKRNLRTVKLWKKIKNKFVLEDGLVSHKRVTEEMEKQLNSRLRRQVAGAKGAEVRWKTDSKANGNAITEPMAKNSSSSSSLTSSSKKEKNIKKRKVFVPPSEDQVVSYFKEKGYSEEAGKKAHEYYSEGNWIDINGHKVFNWKMKMIANWFKDENRAKGNESWRITEKDL